MHNSYWAASRKTVALRVLTLFVAGVTLAGCGSGGQKQGQAKTPATSVHTVTVKPHTVPVYSEYPGRVNGKQTAQVIGRVTGILESKNYNEGSLVHKGDLLFKIDPRPYQATVDQREAQLASAKAALANSSRVWERTRKLYQANAVSEAERDQALSNYESDKAAVQQAKANLESARIDLDYTTVEAPLTGVTSLRDVDLGALVTANQTKLTTITQLDPVYVLFALPEDDAFARQKALREMGQKTTDSATRQATIILNNGKVFPYKGKVDFTQSTIDPNTGTVQLRAIVKNPNNRLMPGRYVRVRVRIQTLHDAITVPAQAISTGQRTQVFVVKNGKAETRAVTLGPLTESGRVIQKGLSPGARVITTGLGTLSAGAPVKVLPGSGLGNEGAAVNHAGNQSEDQAGASDTAGSSQDS
ncbi:efflux RND transporter periplasmic adaptor subunit [Salinisphaera sp.]|uniref:efflux RND transporter periplasmic adaptor subunit n=1 Tax=Salinisphaera sp. TaxID=1914330 RepID=UPI002D769AFE|nr:efflux RND transporter periplasmic adaptor subunit [Salinisphaera sp.]HET7314918.1 efflux RND transporter periplasmic adaptor subunit [Salinisphaera sp.]